MSTSLHAVFNFIFGNVYSVIVISNNHGRKMRFSESTPNSISEKSIFGQFEVSFLNAYKFFPGRGGNFLLVHLSRSILTER